MGSVWHRGRGIRRRTREVDRDLGAWRDEAGDSPGVREGHRDRDVTVGNRQRASLTGVAELATDDLLLGEDRAKRHLALHAGGRGDGSREDLVPGNGAHLQLPGRLGSFDGLARIDLRRGFQDLDQVLVGLRSIVGALNIEEHQCAPQCRDQRSDDQQYGPAPHGNSPKKLSPWPASAGWRGTSSRPSTRGLYHSMVAPQNVLWRKMYIFPIKARKSELRRERSQAKSASISPRYSRITTLLLSFSEGVSS